MSKQKHKRTPDGFRKIRRVPSDFKRQNQKPIDVFVDMMQIGGPDNLSRLLT